jgi:CelD/BcsL family acetyltransferase involved in cellulose biosynthesis
MNSELIAGDRVFTELEGEWDDLVKRSMTQTPFQFLAYQRNWWQHLGPKDGRLSTMITRQEDSRLTAGRLTAGRLTAGRLTAIATFFNLEGVLHFNGCVEESDYLDLIVAEEDAAAAWTAVFDCLGSPSFPQWHTLDLCNVPATSLTRQILPQEAEKRGFLFEESVQEVCPIIPLPATFDAYLESMGSKQRHEAQRKLRRAEGADATLRLITAADDLVKEVDNFLELLQKSTYEKREWLTAERRAFFHDIARAAMDAGILQLLFMEVDGRRAAALFNFDYNNHIWVYNSGLDPALAGNLSLGVVITAKAIELAIGNGRGTFDFLRGNETYKYRFGAQDTTIYRQQLRKQ